VNVGGQDLRHPWPANAAEVLENQAFVKSAGVKKQQFRRRRRHGGCPLSRLPAPAAPTGGFDTGKDRTPVAPEARGVKTVPSRGFAVFARVDPAMRRALVSAELLHGLACR
jgi:hypothetical protein